jgi:FixJ family two-component response regulator
MVGQGDTGVMVTKRLSADARGATPVVFLVHSDICVRGPLESLIRAQGWQPLTFASAGEFLALPPLAAASCLVLDVILPDLNGLDVQQRVSDRNDMPLIFITGQTDVQTTVRAMKAGALEYLINPFENNVLLSAISFALERSHAVRSYEAVLCALRERYDSLSHREREILQLVVSGWLNKQIGAALGLSEVTVKAHRSKMMRKMTADSLPDLVRMASMMRLTTLPNPQRASLGPSAARNYSSQARRDTESASA